jgi:hypothetical protein
MDKKTYFTESVKNNGFATYPFTEGYHDPEYPDYDFKGWKINGVTYTPPYTESMFKITSNTVIEAVWEAKAGDTSYQINPKSECIC